MKLTSALLQQHVGRMFRDHWKVQGKKRVLDHGALRILKKQGIEFEDALDVVKENPPTREKVALKGFKPVPLAFDENHPDYHEVPSLVYGDHSVLLEGLNQAKVLTNTVELNVDHLPILDQSMIEQDLPLQDKFVKRCIKSSLMYDATQEKLPKRHDPTREAWIFPRDYGITDIRRNYLLVNRLVQLCSSFSPQLLGKRSVVNEAKFVVPVTLPSEEKILFCVTGNAVVFANKHPKIDHPQSTSDLELPDISPLAPTVSLELKQFYKFQPSFPLNTNSKLNKIHTVLLHYNETKIGNLFGSPVTTDQILGRSLMQSWIFALAQSLQDGSSSDLHQPITIQTVQTNGQFFHFSILQLNSATCSSQTAPKNFYWSFPIMNIFDTCSYQKGLPILEGYNPKVFKLLLAFFNNS